MAYQKQNFYHLLFQVHIYIYILYGYYFETIGVSKYIVIGAVIYTTHNIALFMFMKKTGIAWQLILDYIRSALLTCAILLAILIALDIYFYTGGGIFDITR